MINRRSFIGAIAAALGIGKTAAAVIIPRKNGKSRFLCYRNRTGWLTPEEVRALECLNPLDVTDEQARKSAADLLEQFA